MNLNSFIKHNVNPGEPLTAQAWNDLVDAIDAAYRFLRAQMQTVEVTIGNTDGLAPDAVRVVASRADLPPIEAVRPPTAGKPHVLTRLELGAWELRASADGYVTTTDSITVVEGPTQTKTIVLAPLGPRMPDLFGMPLRDARKELAAKGISLTRVLDFNGNETPPANPAKEFDAAPVLEQRPLPGDVVLAGKSAQLAVGVKPTALELVTVPSLSGLTVAGAKKALEAVGLQLGELNYVSK